MKLSNVFFLLIFNVSFSQEFKISTLTLNSSNIILEEISGIGINSDDDIIIFHRGNNALIKVDKDGNILKVFNDDVFSNSHGLKIDRYDNIWTTDLNTHLVLKLDKIGNIKMVLGKNYTPGTWLVDSLQSNGFSDWKSMSLFNKPADISFDSDDNIYVADGYGNNRIVKFNSEGKFILEWGTKGNNKGEFNLPHGITIDNNDIIYVADRENARIQLFDTNGNFIRYWENVGYPYGIKYFNGFIYISDARNEKIKKINLKGEILWEVGSPGKSEGQFGWAHGLDIDSDGNIYVSEILNWRIQKIKINNEIN